MVSLSQAFRRSRPIQASVNPVSDFVKRVFGVCAVLSASFSCLTNDLQRLESYIKQALVDTVFVYWLLSWFAVVLCSFFGSMSKTTKRFSLVSGLEC